MWFDKKWSSLYNAGHRSQIAVHLFRFDHVTFDVLDVYLARSQLLSCLYSSVVEANLNRVLFW